jgi:hypothetical protein
MFEQLLVTKTGVFDQRPSFDLFLAKCHLFSAMKTYEQVSAMLRVETLKIFDG